MKHKKRNQPTRGRVEPRDVLPGVTEAAGRAFAAVFAVLKLVRPDRPIHPKGTGLSGKLTRTGTPGKTSGVDWLDTPGTDPVTARFSRSAGLPEKFPDILGLALRLPRPDGGSTDLLFASTGWRFPGRFLLQPKLGVPSAALTTLMPYQGRRGPVLVGLRTLSLPSGTVRKGEWVLGLYWAEPTGSWQRCGELRLQAAAHPADTPLRFNPLENPPPGAQTYAWARRLREHSYRTAQQPARHAAAHSASSNPLAAPSPAANPTRKTAGRNTMPTVSQLFNTPAADVWRVIADGWLYSGWVVGASRIRAVDDTWPHAGSRLYHSVGAWPMVINDSTKVISTDHGRSLEIIARGWPIGEAKVVLTLEDRGNQCLVTIAEDAIRGPGKLMPKFLLDPLISARNRESLRRLELMAAGGAGK